MASFGIMGSGFGIYGYLPALARLGHEIVVPYSYSTKIHQRKELEPHWTQVTYASEKEIIESLANLVIAKDPQSQFELVTKLSVSNQKLWLEKPLAPTVEMHKEVIEHLRISGFDFSVGYLFQFTSWWREIQRILSNSETSEIQLIWKISKPIGWKQIHGVGGGISDFFGIHFSPFLEIPGVILQFTEMSEPDDSVVVVLGNDKGSTLKIEIEYSQSSLFSVTTKGTNGESQKVFSKPSPFGSLPLGGQPDPRICFLEQYILTNCDSPKQFQKHLSLEEKAVQFRQAFLH